MKWRRRKDTDLNDALSELEDAKKRHSEIIEHSPEVVKITLESREYQRGNGFYLLFMQGLKGNQA